MPRLALLLLAAAACSSNDNMVVSDLAILENVSSTIHGVAFMRDQNGNPVGDQLAVIIMSDQPNLCDTLTAHRDYFRNAPGVNQALIMTVPLARLGTFEVDRPGDEGTAAEVLAATGPATTVPFHALGTSLISVTDWPDGPGNAVGSFYLITDDPDTATIQHQFQGRFKTNQCATLDGTLLP